MHRYEAMLSVGSRVRSPSDERLYARSRPGEDEVIGRFIDVSAHSIGMRHLGFDGDHRIMPATKIFSLSGNSARAYR